MAKAETNILNGVRLKISSMCRTFRNNVGLFTTEHGDKIRTGLCKGSSDLIGWVPVEVTPDMVGSQVCIFLAIEVKSGRGRASHPQLNFINQINGAGGIAFVTRSPDEAEMRLLKCVGRLRNGESGV